MWFLGLAVLLFSVSAETDDCAECKVVVQRISQSLAAKNDSEKLSFLGRFCTTGDSINTRMCLDILNADNGEPAKQLLKNNISSPLEVCQKAKKCQLVMDGDLDFHAAGVEKLDKLNTTHATDELQALAQVTSGLEQSSSPQSGPSGLAWDKHDFEVTNNKGGDVKVEVNLAAPISSDGDSYDDDDGFDIATIVNSIQPQDNTADIMNLMKTMMEATKAQEAPPLNISDLVSGLKDVIQPPQQDLTPVMAALSDIVKELRHAPPPAQPQVTMPMPPPMNPETIINALQPPPPAPVAPNPPFDVTGFMREMRETLAANKPPPTPPPGLDPQLLDLLRSTLGDLKDLKEQIHNPVSAPPPPVSVPTNGVQPVPTPPLGQPTPPPNQPQSIPPPPVMPNLAAQQDQLRQMIEDMLHQIRPPVIPTLPSTQDADIAAMKEYLKQQEAAAQRPIILPPPVSLDIRPTVVAPPPPPPPPPVDASLGAVDDRLKAMIADIMPKPQRIPAPPQMTVKQEHCCPAPAPEDTRSDAERCPLVNGLPRPRCKRQTPPEVQGPVKCKRGNCNNVDADGDVNITSSNDPNWPGSLPDGMPIASFNPRKLLSILCPGGLCPGQKQLDPALNKKGTALSGSM